MNGKKKTLQMDFLWLVKAQVHQQTSRFNISKELFEKYGANKIINPKVTYFSRGEMLRPQPRLSDAATVRLPYDLVL